MKIMCIKMNKGKYLITSERSPERNHQNTDDKNLFEAEN